FLTLAGLRHDNIVQVYEAGVTGDYPWIAMEYVRGTDLGSLIDRWQEDPPADRFERVEQMLRGLCEALVHVHERGLIHRDLKPSNVLVTEDGVAKLTDFGVVKAPGVFTTQLTMAGRLVGTIAFMAPEQITGDTVDSRADLYSLGAVLYMMLTGEKPIQAESIAGYLSRHLTTSPRPPGELNPAVPPRLESICLRLLAKDPNQRFASARQVLAALDDDDAGSRPMVHGRDAELHRLMGRIEQVAQGAGGVIVVTGPEGIGKTTLLDELRHRAREAGHPVAAADGAAAMPMQALRAQVPGGDPDDEDLTDPGADIAQRTAGRPWTFIVDNLDQLSPAELDGLTRLLRDRVAILGEPLLLIGAVRDVRGRAAEIVSGAATGLTPDIVEIGPLDSRAIVAIVRERGLGGAAAAILGRRLAQESEGVVGAVIEQLVAMEREGWFEHRGGELRVNRDLDALREDPLPVSARVRSREAERLTRLPAEARALLDAVAILGAEAPLSLLAAVAGIARGTATGASQVLAEAGLARRRPKGSDELLDIGSDRLREVVIGELEPARRKELHRAAAHLLITRTRRRSDALTDLILRHLLAGGDEVRAYPLLLQTARRRLAADRVDDAARLLRRAREARERAEPALPPPEVRRHRKSLAALLGEVRARQGDLTGAIHAWQEALDQARAEGDDLLEARALGGIGLAHARRGDVERAAPSLSTACARLPRGDPMWPSVTRALARARLEQGLVDDAESLWHELIAVAVDTGSERAEAQGKAGLAVVALAQQPLDRAREALARAAARLRVLEDDDALVPVLLRLAEVLMADGALHEARERAAEAERASRGPGRLVGRIHAMGLTASILAALDDPVEARQVAREAVSLIRTLGSIDTPRSLLAILPVVRALLDIDLPADAEGLLPDALPVVAPGLDDVPGQLLALQARRCSWREPARASDLVARALARPAPLLRTATARIGLDCAHAVIRAHDPEAAEVVAIARGRANGAGMRLWRLESLVLGEQAGDPAAAAEAQALAATLDEALGAGGRFAARWRPAVGGRDP
ncbi:MAG: hypothetical protein D6798_16370, partial [Deltaproteobacteria bacterium]